MHRHPSSHPPSHCPQLLALPALVRQFQSAPASLRIDLEGVAGKEDPGRQSLKNSGFASMGLLQGRSALCPAESLPLVASWQLWSTLAVPAGVPFLGLQPSLSGGTLLTLGP